jgi:hypothetical protein
MVVFRRLAASHIFERPNLAGHATPERQPRFASPKKTFHAASKSERASSKLAAVPS